MLFYGMSPAYIARFLGIDDQTVARWLEYFGAHTDHLHSALLREPHPASLQLDERVAALRSGCIKQWRWLAIDPKTKLVLSYHFAARTLTAAITCVTASSPSTSPSSSPTGC
jgi:transposase-like protein